MRPLPAGCCGFRGPRCMMHAHEPRPVLMCLASNVPTLMLWVQVERSAHIRK